MKILQKYDMQGVKISLASDPANSTAVGAFLGADAFALNSLKGYAALITNESTQGIRATGINFRWTGPDKPAQTNCHTESC